jgi:antitoxin component of MazEF toxin-antitoxin module
MTTRFEGTFVKWGNSVGFSLPKAVRDGMNLNPTDKITITVEHDKNFLQVK